MAAQPYEQWHTPFREETIALGEAYEGLRRLPRAVTQDEVPFLVQLVENPRYDLLPLVDLFHGAVDLKTHDLLHIVLGRGLLPKDEAFVIGFCMGSTDRVSTTEERLYAWISKYLYPGVYRFGDEEIRIFRDAVKLGFISDCRRLDRIDFEPMLGLPLGEVRERIGLERGLVLAYFEIERRRYPDSAASRRLLDGPSGDHDGARRLGS